MPNKIEEMIAKVLTVMDYVEEKTDDFDVEEYGALIGSLIDGYSRRHNLPPMLLFDMISTAAAEIHKEDVNYGKTTKDVLL